ncbi:MAG TPA: heterodisulfide reductase-related iron-sulfur binding cluster [Gammaproteobacteria bacterium]|nr:heterodisulfide reductase-related iron-sulfur binding cluster [Gammaproteobacteria bacterium]
MTDTPGPRREGSLEAPTRHPIDWRSPQYSDARALEAELERVFDICHGCRRCFSLCNSFPTLFDAVDATASGEVHEVPKTAYWQVVEHCYLCDMCYMTKCPYVPPHEWNVDFPHLMLRAKAKSFKDGKASLRDKLLSSTDAVGSLAGIPVVAEVVNAFNASAAGRGVLEKVLGVDREAPVPKYHSRTARKRLKDRIGRKAEASPAGETQGRVVVFATCYGNRNHPGLVEDLVAVLEHNGIATAFAGNERCCGMPKLELGDLESIEKLKDANIDELDAHARAGWDLTAVVPSCVLMFKQELPLLFPDDERVQRVARAFYDPFEYLMLRHKAGKLKTDFAGSLGKISYQVPCHLRVQNIGLKTRDVLQLVPGTEVQAIERCSGHDGTYGVKKEFAAVSRKIARPVARQVDGAGAATFTSDCPMAAEQVAKVASSSVEPTHPIQLLRRAYGL